MKKAFTLRDIEQLAARGLIRGYTEPSKGAGKGNCSKKGEGSVKGQRKSKYGSERVEVDGIVFDSRKEARRYSELKILLKAGEIAQLERQVPYELNQGGTHSLRYIADFVYVKAKTGERVVEDVKSEFTARMPLYKKKKKLMKKIYGIEINEI